MVNSLDIRNYRNLSDLRLSSLRKINLITGKNNTGKSTILEAVALYAMSGDLSFIYQLLGERGENYREREQTKSNTELNVRSLSSLFTNRVVGFEKANEILISSPENTLFGTQNVSDKTVRIRFARFVDEFFNEGDAVLSKRTIIESPNALKSDWKVGLEISSKGSSRIVPLDRDRPARFNYRDTDRVDNCQFIRTRNIDREINGKLWDNVALTVKENFVVDALKIIEPNIERVTFVEEYSKDRAAVVKTAGSNGVLPLRSMGDGINRVMTIILALVNSDNGFLLIDEFENGLHHSVQEKLWHIIFDLSTRLNIQVFVTTHSDDCIRSFESALNHEKNSSSGKLIRLDRVGGVIKQVEFNADELKIASNHNIETR